MRIVIIICLSILFSSCEYLDNLTTSGELINREFDASTIKYIVAESPCRIELQNKNTETIRIACYEHLWDGLQLSYRNDSLIINHENKHYLQKSKLPILTISSAQLQRITANMAIEISSMEPIVSDNFTIIINGTAKFTETDLAINTSNFNLHIYGNNNIGNYQIKGRSTNVFINMEGSVFINAEELNCTKATIIQKSIGNCIISTDELLKVDTYSTGNTLYKGYPTIKHQHIDVPYFIASGNVIQID